MAALCEECPLYGRVFVKAPLKVLIFWGEHPRKSKLSGLPVPLAERDRTGYRDVSGNNGSAWCRLRRLRVIFNRASIRDHGTCGELGSA
jgi:hypothetical protein